MKHMLATATACLFLAVAAPVQAYDPADDPRMSRSSASPDLLKPNARRNFLGTQDRERSRAATKQKDSKYRQYELNRGRRQE